MQLEYPACLLHHQNILDFLAGVSQFCKFAFIPQPLIPEEPAGWFQNPTSLREGLRVRATNVGCSLSWPLLYVFKEVR